MRIISMDPMTVTPGEDINPYRQDEYHMGCRIGKNVTVMYEKPDSDDQPYLIIVNTNNGERIKIMLD